MEMHVRAIWILACLAVVSAVPPAAAAADRSLARLLVSNLSSHYQSPARVGASVRFACAGVHGRYMWEQSSDAATGDFRVRLTRVEANGGSLPASALARINGVLAGPAMLRSSSVSCSGQYVNLQIDLHRMTSKPTASIRAAQASYVVEMKGDDLLDVRTLTGI